MRDSVPSARYSSVCNVLRLGESRSSLLIESTDSMIPPYNHTHTFHPLSTIVIHTLNFAQVKSMDDNCGEWVECMGVASGCG